MDQNTTLIWVSYRLLLRMVSASSPNSPKMLPVFIAQGVRFVLGGTPPVAECVRQLGFFGQIDDVMDQGETIHNAWCAILLFWFYRRDEGDPWNLEGFIRQRRDVIVW